MWLHRKTDYDWRPSRLIAQALPESVVYWTLIRAGSKNMLPHEVVPEVPFTTILQRVGRELPERMQ
jgi:hypothetical protein